MIWRSHTDPRLFASFDNTEDEPQLPYQPAFGRLLICHALSDKAEREKQHNPFRNIRKMKTEKNRITL